MHVSAGADVAPSGGNRALHTITLSRLICHPETKAYATRRLAEGKTSREIRRCLKRHIARRIYKLLEHTP